MGKEAAGVKPQPSSPRGHGCLAGCCCRVLLQGLAAGSLVGPGAEVLDAPDGGVDEDRREGVRHPSRPAGGAGIVRDEVLADLDQSMGKAPDRRVLVERVALEAAVIGLVVADDQMRVGAEGGDHRLRDARVLVPQKA